MLGLSQKQVIFLILFIILLVAVPIGAVLVQRNRQKIASQAIQERSPNLAQEAGDTFQSLKDLLNAKPSATPEATQSGTLLTLAVSLEARKPADQSVELFLGIAEVEASPPKYLQTKSITTDALGKVTTTLSGLFPGKTYTLYIKGPQHLAEKKSLILQTGTNDISGEKALLLTGDVNADNIIDKFDQGIVQNAFGSVPTDKLWNPLSDLNHDLIVNNADLGLIARNFGKSGAGGPWYSPNPPATSSAR